MYCVKWAQYTVDACTVVCLSALIVQWTASACECQSTFGMFMMQFAHTEMWTGNNAAKANHCSECSKLPMLPYQGF